MRIEKGERETEGGSVANIRAEGEVNAEKILAAFKEICSDPTFADYQISARDIALRAGVEPDRAVELLFQLAAAQILTFDRSSDANPDSCFARCPSV